MPGAWGAGGSVELWVSTPPHWKTGFRNAGMGNPNAPVYRETCCTWVALGWHCMTISFTCVRRWIEAACGSHHSQICLSRNNDNEEIFTKENEISIQSLALCHSLMIPDYRMTLLWIWEATEAVPPVWETMRKLLDPGFCLTLFQLLWRFGEWTNRWVTSLACSLLPTLSCFSAFQKSNLSKGSMPHSTGAALTYLPSSGAKESALCPHLHLLLLFCFLDTSYLDRDEVVFPCDFDWFAIP